MPPISVLIKPSSLYGAKVTQKKSMTNVKLLGNLPEIVWIVQHGH